MKVGTQVDLSSIFTLNSEQSKKNFYVFKDMLYICVMDFGGQWEQDIALTEFSYNHKYHSRI